MTDATSRAREVTNRLLLAAENACCYLTTEPEAYLELRKAVGAAADILLNKTDSLRIIDTRTHAAIAREPSEADVSRIASVLFMCGPDMTFHDQARAAIAALVAAQTQGGEPDAPA